jgi:hypothetical protein
MTDQPAILLSDIEGSVIRFKSLNGMIFFGTYDPENTSLGRVINTLFNNYECKSILRDQISMHSEELDKPLCELDSNELMKTFQFSQITTFTLWKTSIRRPQDPEALIDSNNGLNFDSEKHLNKLLTADNTFQIFCKNLYGRIYCVNVRPDFSIIDLKLLISHLANVSIDQQQLVHCGKILDGHGTIKESGIQKEQTIYMVLNLRGGMYHETSGRDGGYGALQSNVFIIEPDNEIK